MHRHMSTSHALLELVEEITSSLDNKKYSVGIFIKLELEKIHMWFSANRLSLNVAKTNYMFFGKRKVIVDISIKMNKEVINRVSVTKCLGVMIDDKLTWKHHY